MTARGAAFVLIVALLASACGGGGAAEPRRPVTVFAAASLSEAFRAMQKQFTKDNDRYDLRFSFAGSQQLATQVSQGAPADVIATADRVSMSRAEPKTLHRAPTMFARNRLVIAVRPGNPLGIKTLADLSRAGVKVVLAAPAVPAGNYARQVLSKAHVNVNPVSNEDNVEGVVTKVALGEADAGIVYETDARSPARGIEAVAIAEDHNVLAEYFVMVLPKSKQKSGGDAFRSFLLSSPGRKVLERFGFATP